MEYKKLDEIIEFNPKENIDKKQLAKKISMDNLACFTKYIKSYSLEEYNGGMKFRNGDTLLARITPCLENGKTSKVTILDENEVGFGSTEYIVMRSKRDISDGDFIFYLAISPMFRDIAIKSMTGTSGRQRVQLDVVRNTEMLVPSYQEQVKIGKILSNIDKKIELNNQINDNLQDFARLLFENKFQEKKCNAKLKELVSLKKDTIKISTKNLDLGYYPIDILPMNYLVTKTAKPNDEAKSSLIGFSKYDILLGSMRVYFHRVCLAGNDGITRNTTFVFVPKIKEYLYYALLLIDKEDFINYASKTSKGTTMPYAVWEALAEYDIYLPTIEELEEFNKALYPLFEKMIYNEKEKETLSQLRDTLLPKLMNGEIDLNSIEI